MYRGIGSVALAVTLLTASVANAHEVTGSAGGFLSGFTHPLLGWDHVAAMVAVGLWGALLGLPAIWVLPVVFPLIMAGGAVLGIVGVPIPAVEIGIATSAVVLGAMVAFAARPPLWVAIVLVGAFAVFHGYAHGAELPAGTAAAVYVVGFVVSTGLLHLVGIGIGLLGKWHWGRASVRAAGGAIALAGVAFLSGLA